MLHESGIPPEVPQIAVDFAEYAKFCYLIKVMDAVDRAHLLAKERAYAFKSAEGVVSYMDYDWSQLARFIQPQLHLTFLQDAERKPEEQVFMKHPLAVIVARTAVVVDLTTEFELSLEGSGLHPEADEVTNASLILEVAINALDGKRKEDGMVNLNRLKRVLRLKL